MEANGAAGSRLKRPRWRWYRSAWKGEARHADGRRALLDFSDQSFRASSAGGRDAAIAEIGAGNYGQKAAAPELRVGGHAQPRATLSVSGTSASSGRSRIR